MASSRRALTEQERIDEATLKITNPNVVGSGYIQFPPQVPFQQPIHAQPLTVVVRPFHAPITSLPSCCFEKRALHQEALFARLAGSYWFVGLCKQSFMLSRLCANPGGGVLSRERKIWMIIQMLRSFRIEDHSRDRRWAFFRLLVAPAS